MKILLIAPIKLYRKYISPAKLSPCCRFYPTCSEYGLKAVREWGFFIGFFLTAFRILRCNPLCRSGYDPVPRRKRKTVPKTFGYLSKSSYEKVVMADKMNFLPKDFYRETEKDN